MFCPGHPKGAQPVPHPGFQNQRFPSGCPTISGGSGAPFPCRFGRFRGSGPEFKIYIFKSIQKPATIRGGGGEIGRVGFLLARVPTCSQQGKGPLRRPSYGGAISTHNACVVCETLRDDMQRGPAMQSTGVRVSGRPFLIVCFQRDSIAQSILLGF